MTTSSPLRTSAAETTVDTLIAEAAEWRLIELLFECPSAEWRAQITALGEEVQDPELRSAAKLAAEAGAEGTFHSLFGAGGPAPPREASYQRTLALGNLIAEVKSFYDAFGWAPVSSEPLDHVSVEAGFIGFLKLKQAFALTCGAGEEASIAEEAARDFLGQHLVWVAEPLSAALEMAGEPYLELAGKALLQRVGPRLKDVFNILDEAAEDDGVFECGDT